MQVGKYQLVSKLATGGMAEVFLAKAAGPMGFEKTLVLKRILPHMAEESAFVDMFLAEARLAAQLNHPNIVQIFDFGEVDGTYYLAMEYIDGPNLRVLGKRVRASGGELPPPLCAKIIASACEGLAFAHDFCDPNTGEHLGLIHRDISPDNIMVSRQGAVKVVDFGIAKAAGQASQKTQTGVLKGKLAYMPPEQLQARDVDLRVDVYALGVVLYEMLTGQKPFDAATDVTIMQAILFEELVPASQRRPDLPAPLLQILDRALAKSRDERYPDCHAFQADLERYVMSTGEPMGAYQISQFIKQLSGEAGQSAPMPTPGRGSRSSAGHARSSPNLETRVDTSSAVVEPERSRGPRTGARSRPRITVADIQEPEGEFATRATELDQAPITEESLAPVGGKPRWLIPVVAGAVLLVAGGAFVALRPSANPSAGSGEAASASARPAPSDPVPPKVDPAPTPSKAVAAVTPSGSDTRGAETKGSGTNGAEETRAQAGAARSEKQGTVEFRVRPYATVIIDGKTIGQTPFKPIQLPEGTYTVRLVNQNLKKDVTRPLEVIGDETVVFKHNLLRD